ncbi:MAG: DsbE family thiol:disulfide interchange protein [Thiotrichales bacterium]|nr:DsbE family thiol:disulfide interchange protein [Thiotrichales bacterium]
MPARIEAMDETISVAAKPAAPRRPWPYLLPIAIFAGIGILLYLGLYRDPTLVPSPLIGKPVPEFELGPVQGRELGLSSQDLRREVTLVNVFASWCVACRDEHPLFLDLDREGIVPIHGLNYKDAPEDAAAWLDALGDPYTRIGADLDGRVGLDWGVYGVPETFVVGRDGHIAYKHIGPVTPRVLDEIILPLVRALSANG